MRIRCTVRRMMLAVAGAAVVTAGARWGASMWERSRMYRFEAELHEVHRKVATILRSDPRSARRRASARAAAEWHARRRDLYNAAAARPWRDVPFEKAPEIDDGPDEPPAPKARDAPRADPSLRLTRHDARRRGFCYDRFPSLQVSRSACRTVGRGGGRHPGVPLRWTRVT